MVSVLLEKMAGNEWEVMWHQAPNHMKSLKRWTLRLLSDYKRVIWVSCATVPFKHQDRCPAGRYKNTHKVSRAEVKTIQRLLICWVMWAQGQCSTGCSVTTQRLLVQVQGEAQDGEGGRLSTPLLISFLSCVWVWSRVGDVLTLSQSLVTYLRWKQYTGS